jgi:hypothetical protein
LLPSQHQAIDRVRALQKHHADGGLPLLHRDANPCTTVARLVELLYSRAKTSAKIHEDFWREARKVERRVPAVVRK